MVHVLVKHLFTPKFFLRKDVSPVYFWNLLVSSLTFKFMILFELIFVYTMR